MVLVDSTHVDENEPITPLGGGYLPYFPRLIPTIAQILRQIGVLRMFMQQTEESPTPKHHKSYTAEEVRLMLAFEPRTMAESFQEMDYESMLEARAVRDMGDIPLIVLTATIHTVRPPGNPVKAREVRVFENSWIVAQQQLARLSTRGVQVVLPETNHAIQKDRPDAVIEAVREVVSTVRAGH